MSQSFEKGVLLYNEGRFDLAVEQFRMHLADRPDDGEALGLLAICSLHLGRAKEASKLAERAVDAQPDHPTPHYASALIWRRRKHPKKAFESIKRALGVSPDDADYLAFLGLLHADKGDYQNALRHAENALGFDSHCINAHNVRAIALTGLGRPGPGQEVLEAILTERPHDSLTLANLGWNQLHQHRWKEALDYFSRSLQEDAENSYAREGFLEALRAQNPVYGFFLRYFLWLSRFSESSRWALMIAENFLHKALEELGRRYRSLRPLISAILTAYGFFSYLTWVAKPLANLGLRLHPQGRRLLTQDEADESLLVGLCLACSGASWVAYKFLHWRLYIAWFVLFSTIILPVTSIYDCPKGWPRQLMGGYTLGLFGLGVYAVWAFFQAPLTGGGMFQFYGLGLLLSRLMAMYLVRREKEDEESGE